MEMNVTAALGQKELRADLGPPKVGEVASDRWLYATMTRRRFHRRIYLGILRRQKLCCACGCGVKLTTKEGYQFDHTTALALGGADSPDNLRAVRVPCHKKISASDIWAIRKADRQGKYHRGEKKRHGRKLASPGFQKRLRRRFDGTVEVRT